MAEYLQNVEAVESALEGCPDPTAGSAVIIPEAGITGEMDTVTNPEFLPSVKYQLRDGSGNPIDLT